MRICFPLLVAACAAVALLSGCEGGKKHSAWTVAPGGSPARGKILIAHYGCGKCHVIPGIDDANGSFGPPLTAMSQRTLIAGEFPNVPQNLVRWIQSPVSMKPKTAMPVLGLNQQEATDVASYLDRLQ